MKSTEQLLEGLQEYLQELFLEQKFYSSFEEFVDDFFEEG